MKKIIVCFLFFFMIIPLQVHAVSIKNTTIMGKNEVDIGTEFELSFVISFDGIRKGDENSLGLAAVSYELIYDDSVFKITDITSDGYWDSKLYTEDGKYYVVSQVGENNADKNKCVDGVLYCADYLVNIHFFVRDTNIKTSDIKIGKIEAGLLEMIFDLDKDIEEDDIVLVSGEGNAVQTMKIKEIQIEKEVEEPKSIVSKEKININESALTLPIDEKSNSSSEPSKSNNNYLSSLSIENYNIKFNKYKSKYTIRVKDDVNSLKINLELEDSKSTYNIIGADDLKANNNQVLIEVKAENENVRTYTINIDNEDVKSPNKEKDNPVFKLNKHYIYIGGIILTSILVLIILIRLIMRIHDRKIDKDLNSL